MLFRGLFRKPKVVTASELLATEAELAGILQHGVGNPEHALLLDKLRPLGGAIVHECLTIADRYVAVDGWENVFADMAELEARGARISAIGIDVSGHGDGKEPSLEVSLYNDDAFSFSTTDRDALIEAATTTPPWAGDFLSLEHSLVTRNLSSLNAAIRACPVRHATIHDATAPLPTDYAACRLGTLYLQFRVHWAVAQFVAKAGTPRALPIIVGEHDFGAPSFASAYLSPESRKLDGAVDAVLAKRGKNRAASFDTQTEAIIEDLKEQRNAIVGWRLDHNRDKRLLYMEYVRAEHAVTYNQLGLEQIKQVWEFGDSDFRAELERVRRARNVNRTQPPSR